jgi:hypothetical protein
LTGPLEHPGRDVNADHAAGGGGAGRLARGLAGTAADVEHPITGADASSGAKVFVVAA